MQVSDLFIRRPVFAVEVSLLLTDAEGNIAHAEMSYRGAPIGVAGEWEGLGKPWSPAQALSAPRALELAIPDAVAVVSTVVGDASGRGCSAFGRASPTWPWMRLATMARGWPKRNVTWVRRAPRWQARVGPVRWVASG